ncbi:hypothetical protein LCGC14_3103920 [marine sediment metagenome]|uniref:Uncharacterized protein n=1 Tax=marine sediment metagenome TaxID=412755 RepID=A0A0F8W7C5_9ZZZZ
MNIVYGVIPSSTRARLCCDERFVSFPFIVSVVMVYAYFIPYADSFACGAHIHSVVGWYLG